ncbi:MAG: beta-propeller fold lactonase family protein [Erysipelotrichaceae bacterium]|nr:beta-propeller fold lactonase family protein [Erysipelotrichaceae bacterium]
MKEIYVGTYEDDGIYKISCEAGHFTVPERFCDISGCKYLSSMGDKLIAIYKENDELSGVAVINKDGKVETKLAFEMITSCFITYHDGKIYTANFHEGTVSVIAYENNGLKLVKKLFIKEKAGCHQVLFHDDLILINALFMDKIYIYNQNFDLIQTIVFPDGTGPRHGVFSADRKYLYQVSELSNEVFVIRTADWQILNKIKLTDVESARSAAIRLVNDKLYVSVRGTDKVHVLAVKDESLTLIDCLDCHGKSPRDMIVIDDDIICANLQSDCVTVLKNDSSYLTFQIPKAVSLYTD